MKAQQYEQAIRTLKTITELNEHLSGPYINMGIAYMKLGDIPEADRAFRRALEMNPKNPVVLNLLGMLQRAKGQFEDAERFYKSALATYPDYPYAHLNMGILCDLYIHKVDCALSHYQKYLQLSSGEDKQVSMWIADLKRRGKATVKRAGID
jgi:Tfp pilus assembly protein PilF